MTRPTYRCLLLFLIFIPLFSFGLNQHRIDSLAGILARKTDDKTRCDLLRQMVDLYIRADIGKAKEFNDQSLALARKINYTRGISEAVYNEASLYRLKGKYDSALSLLIRERPVFVAVGDSIVLADYLSEVGSLYAAKSDLKNGLIILLEALRIYQVKGSTKNLALLYNRFGALYRSQKQLDSALKYYQKSLVINNATGFKLGASANLVNIGTIYEDKEEREKAIGYFQQALEIKEKIGDKQGICKCLNNIGTSYMNLGKVSHAIEYHEKALALAYECNSNLDVVINYINLGFDYQRGNNFRKAIEYAGKGLEMAKKINDLQLLTEAARVLHECWFSLKNYPEAYRYHVMYEQFKDSIVKENNLKAMAEIQAKYNMVAKENEITALRIGKNRQELEIQTFRAWFNLGVAMFIALAALAFFFYFRSRISRKLSVKLAEINEMKSHFFANLSHEFRTPLTLMLGPAGKLMETARPEDKPWLELIQRNASRLLYLDEQLLEFTRIDSGSQKIHLYSGNILVPLRTIAESYSLMAEQKNIRYTCHFPEEPLQACFDNDILEKVVSNLLSNAFKYTPSPGTVTLTVTAGSWNLTADPARGDKDNRSFVRIGVSDSGIGIPENKKEIIFERFFQLSHYPGGAGAGVGLGLALTRELLKLHRGYITLESTEGKGSLFSVFFPLDRDTYSAEELKDVKPWEAPLHKAGPPVMAEDQPSGPLKAEGEVFEQHDDDGVPQVLVVDDNEDMRLYIREILRETYHVTEAGNGDAGFDIACATVPDLIVTDVMMHPVNGIEFCKKLKVDERTSHIPVIMLTALSGAKEKIAGLETGADDYITKPFSTRELLVRISNLVNQRKKLRQLFAGPLKLEPGAISVTSADEKFLQKLIRIIEENIDNPELEVEFLVDRIAMSRSQLHRKIKALTGEPITGFIRVIRIKRAAQLMEQKFGNVSDIMYAVGFNNLSYFTKSFREVYDMTPTEYMAKQS